VEGEVEIKEEIEEEMGKENKFTFILKMKTKGKNGLGSNNLKIDKKELKTLNELQEEKKRNLGL